MIYIGHGHENSHTSLWLYPLNQFIKDVLWTQPMQVTKFVCSSPPASNSRGTRSQNQAEWKALHLLYFVLYNLQGTVLKNLQKLFCISQRTYNFLVNETVKPPLVKCTLTWASTPWPGGFCICPHLVPAVFAGHAKPLVAMIYSMRKHSIWLLHKYVHIKLTTSRQSYCHGFIYNLF